MNKQNRDIILIKLDTQFIQAVEKTVGEIEQHTDSEVVVVAHARVDPWSVLSLRAALTVVALVLCFVVWSPWTFHVQWLPLELLVIGLLVGWWAKTSPRLLRLFVGKARIRERVEEAASAAFHNEAVHSTRGRTGILVFIAVMEDRVVVLPDAGVEAKVPGGALHSIRWGRGSDLHEPDDLQSLLNGLSELGQVLSQHIPALEDNPDELSNAPRIRT